MKITLLLILIIISSVSFGQSSKKESKPVGCTEDSMYGNPDSGEIHKLANGGSLFICGYKSKDGFYGELYFQRPDSEAPIATKINLGGTGEFYGPFSTELVQYELTKSGIKIIDLIPFDETSYIKAFERIITCEKEICTEQKSKCIFKTQTGKVDKKAFSVIQNFAKNKKSALPEDSVIMSVYKNALMGHKDSREILLNQKVMKKMDQKTEENSDNTEGSAHNMTNRTLKLLVQAGCF